MHRVCLANGAAGNSLLGRKGEGLSDDVDTEGIRIWHGDRGVGGGPYNAGEGASDWLSSRCGAPERRALFLCVRSLVMDIEKAELIANELIQEHLQSFGHWLFRFDHAVTRLGSCRFKRSRIVDGTVVFTGGIITLSKPYTALNTEEAVTETILHEIAHALCGPSDGHSTRWKETARSIGCRGQTCYHPGNVVLPPAKYIAECPNCGRKKECNKRRGISCGHCDDKFNPKYRLVFRNNGTVLKTNTSK